MIKFAIHKNIDNDIGCLVIARLYGLKPGEFIIWDYDNTLGYRGKRFNNYIHLGYRDNIPYYNIHRRLTAMSPGSVEENELKYEQYIWEHIDNINTALQAYGTELCDKLKVNKEDLRNLIRNHDQSKFSVEEFYPYRQYFYPANGEIKNKEIFDIGWLHHQNVNPHHPEYWIMRDDKGSKILDMPILYIAEMLLDWAAMGIKFNDSAYNYYKKSGKDKPFSDNTKKIVESVIDIFNTERDD